MKTLPLNIEAFAGKIPSRLLSQSGKVFYSGRNAFSVRSALYVLGINPGGAPTSHSTETIESHTQEVLNAFADDWSAYRDESWEGAAPGTTGMAPRVLHLFARLGGNPGSIPCSNLVFVRSSREAHLNKELSSLAQLCWPFHEYAIKTIHPRVILCFGKTAGNFVRQRLSANALIDEFIEQNNRRWRSQAFKNANGIKVVVATHPSIADWTARETDPTQLISQALK
ncbi:MAG: hypothetical protein FJ317_04330 [SAR202 cluster bacterium]|nr:hypothetical protein [SAR202 cluster bacterium]